MGGLRERDEGWLEPDRERGSATIINLAIIACILMLTGALLGGVYHAAAKVHAVALADTAAIAAAQVGDCGAAWRVVERNPRFSLTVLRCEAEGLYAQVEVGGGVLFTLSATSRAGPAW